MNSSKNRIYTHAMTQGYGRKKWQNDLDSVRLRRFPARANHINVSGAVQAVRVLSDTCILHGKASVVWLTQCHKKTEEKYHFRALLLGSLFSPQPHTHTTKKAEGRISVVSCVKS
jgi:hypothetical protein